MVTNIENKKNFINYLYEYFGDEGKKIADKAIVKALCDSSTKSITPEIFNLSKENSNIKEIFDHLEELSKKNKNKNTVKFFDPDGSLFLLGKNNDNTYSLVGSSELTKNELQKKDWYKELKEITSVKTKGTSSFLNKLKRQSKSTVKNLNYFTNRFKFNSDTPGWDICYLQQESNTNNIDLKSYMQSNTDKKDLNDRRIIPFVNVVYKKLQEYFDIKNGGVEPTKDFYEWLGVESPAEEKEKKKNAQETTTPNLILPPMAKVNTKLDGESPEVEVVYDSSKNVESVNHTELVSIAEEGNVYDASDSSYDSNYDDETSYKSEGDDQTILSASSTDSHGYSQDNENKEDKDTHSLPSTDSSSTGSISEQYDFDRIDDKETDTPKTVSIDGNNKESDSPLVKPIDSDTEDPAKGDISPIASAILAGLTSFQSISEKAAAIQGSILTAIGEAANSVFEDLTETLISQDDIKEIEDIELTQHFQKQQDEINKVRDSDFTKPLEMISNERTNAKGNIVRIYAPSKEAANLDPSCCVIYEISKDKSGNEKLESVTCGENAEAIIIQEPDHENKKGANIITINGSDKDLQVIQKGDESNTPTLQSANWLDKSLFISRQDTASRRASF